MAARWGGPLDSIGGRFGSLGTPWPVGGFRPLDRAGRRRGAAAAEPAVVQIGAYPYVTIRCKFSDIAAEPHTDRDVYRLDGRHLLPRTQPLLARGVVQPDERHRQPMVGWYTLAADAVVLRHPGGTELSRSSTDCTGAADPDVNFPRFFGINLQFNAAGLLSWRASGRSPRTARPRTYGITWMPGRADHGVYAHEEGHSLGLPHSSGPYASTYDSRWDVMGDRTCSSPPRGLMIPLHTISYHKDLLGWIPATRKLDRWVDTSQTITLERLAQPGSGNYLMAKIPMDDAPGCFYTVEARRCGGTTTTSPATRWCCTGRSGP